MIIIIIMVIVIIIIIVIAFESKKPSSTEKFAGASKGRKETVSCAGAPA